VLRLQPEQSHRQPDLIVQVADGREHHLAYAAQSGSSQLFGRSLARRACDRDDRMTPARAVQAADLTERATRVCDDNQRQAGRRGGFRAGFDQRGGCALFLRLLEKRVTVMPLAAQRNVELPGLNRARIRDHALHAHGVVHCTQLPAAA
jgi:hypothetical protein